MAKTALCLRIGGNQICQIWPFFNNRPCGAISSDNVPQPFLAWPMRALFAALGCLALAGCNQNNPTPEAESPRPVRTVTVAPEAMRPPARFIGVIAATDHAALAFRIGGRLAERSAMVGTDVTAGQVVARLEPENELNALRSAQAATSAARSAMRQADNHYQRQRQLFGRDIVSRADLEAAEQARRAATAHVDSAEAQLRNAELMVGFTELRADAKGVVTTIGAEPGEVVAAGQPIMDLARRGGRDAVFELPGEIAALVGGDSTLLSISLPSQSGTAIAGYVREVSPRADPVTRLFRVRVGLIDPPEAFRLGATVAGQVALAAGGTGYAIPAAAVLRSGSDHVVWVVDAVAMTVSRRKVALGETGPAKAHVASGIASGDIIVTAGVGQLRDGQKVRLAGVNP
jgi:membrane fusion protein, multidrug efflux system